MAMNQGSMINESMHGIDVKARQRIKDAAAFEAFHNEFYEKLIKKSETGQSVVVSDLDLSQNKIQAEQFAQLFETFRSVNARVMRFRLFGCPTLDDQALGVLGDYLANLTAKLAPTELHLSDCAITTEGFSYFMSKLEEVDYYPLKSFSGGGKAQPLYVRMENNYIDDAAIQEKVDSGLIQLFTKTQGRPTTDSGAKVNLLVIEIGRYQQRKGTPPDPERAPPPKQVNDVNSRAAAGIGQHTSLQPKPLQALAGLQAQKQSGWGVGAPRNVGIIKQLQMQTAQSMGQSLQATTKVPAQAGQFRPPSAYGGGGGSAFPQSGNATRATKLQGAAADRSRTPVGRANGGAGTLKAKPKSDLPHPWEEQWSDEYSIPYFWNSETGDSVWEKP